ncbi:MAG: bifunctional glutamate N-acetyltransferase/amino-acid acetyltransferase ArgJ [Gammaproteobacteria bacterium]|nr:bifunctional glutamate N-acetyltransferase/amino-acid acetyltransferase ArgJ [Gammaproteobacteria bacterium]
MAVGLMGLPTLHPVPGIRWGTAQAGIKKPGRTDVVLMEIAAGSTCAAVYTRNAFCAAPVIVAKRHGVVTTPSYLLINTGNANAGTGERGLKDAEKCCQAVAELMGCQPEQVLPFSTGVIGEPLPVDKILAALPTAKASFNEALWAEAARGIMTTDTVPKAASKQIRINGVTVTISGISKGAGMIRPDMATMLAYIATDVAMPMALLQQALSEAMNRSFNCITVDGDTSTNDSCVLVATGKSGVRFESLTAPGFAQFQQALNEVCETLAQAIVRDGEGATKFITIDVEGGSSFAECRQVADAVAHSPLVKTAFFASDPNWGRILAAVGRAGVADLDINKIVIHLGDVCIVRNGGRDPEYTEQAGQKVMANEEITIRINLNRGQHRGHVWTCDFSYDYVKINAEYRT